MDKALNTIIIATATVIAWVLFIIGIRKLKVKKYRKYGLFMSTILIVLGLSGCDIISDKITSENNNSIQNTEYLPDRIQKLNKQIEWTNFVTFWQKLDFIKPNEGKDEFDLFGEYYSAITTEDRENFLNKLAVLIESLKNMEMDEILITDIEIDLLENICQTRIEYMSSGFTSLLMRMMPPTTITDKENSIMDLERKIDTLIELRTDGKINEAEYQDALGIIKEDIEMYSITDTISTNYIYYYSSNLYSASANRTSEDHINEFEDHYATYLLNKVDANSNTYYPEDLDKKYLETKKTIEEIKVALPNLNELVEDLTRYD
ncbi:hypothetical protein KKG41_02505 [Patescibacteria group bacterium]|nr:hypothetical protein [Patescibacteria group bacterium]